MLDVKKAIFLTLVGSFAFGSTGCVSLRGAPKSVISTSDAIDVVKLYRIPNVVSEYRQLSAPAQRVYRNEILSAYFQAIDARYYEFRTGIAGEQRELVLGFDIAQLGLAGLATIAAKSAEELAAVSAVYAGTSASIDKNLYFDQTTVALIAGMDAQRLKVRTGIVQKMSLPSADYPLTAALADLVEYQNAGTLDQAIALVTDEAVKQRVEQKERFDRAVRFACTPEQVAALQSGQTEKLGDFNYEVFNAALTEARAGDDNVTVARQGLGALAEAYGIKVSATMRDGIMTEADVRAVDQLIQNALLGGFCTADEVTSLIQTLQNDQQFSAYHSYLQ
ncbi:hypothetical protein DL238_14340 [Alteriqipengyuania lutimaris]|uniref:Lipoprotein n=2 Tax=Alteriqipengyuania lutimaris TaxID=1538146 RepID=A0A395LGY3_9SPHN|nr:hypothetical protein DL238_14340 [Alteriqipengyuania lutimaris]